MASVSVCVVMDERTNHSHAQVDNLVEETLAKFKRIDFLVNNGTDGRWWSLWQQW